MSRGRWIAVGVALAVAGVLVLAVAGQDPDEIAAECRGHTVGEPGAPTSDAAWLMNAIRSGGRIQELFRAERRDPVWAPAMETEVRRLLSPVLAQTGGVDLTGLCCHRTACRMVVRVAPERRKQLVESTFPGRGNPFATPLLWAAAGFPAAGNWINFDPLDPKHRSVMMRVYRAVRKRFEETTGLDPIGEHRLQRLRSEESIFMFDRGNRSPEDASARAARMRARGR